MTGDGKTALVGELAEFEWRTQQKVTRVYNGDPGGWATIQPYVDLGIVDMIDCIGRPNPWEVMDAIAKGKVPALGGKWIVDPERNARTGIYAYEGFTGFGDILMQDLAKKAAQGVNIGGQAPAVKFKDGEVSVAGNAPAHYGNAQVQLTMAAQESFHLEADYVVWTALARRASDNDTNATILGPQIVGKALTSEAPRWFVYTFRVQATPPDPVMKTAGKHVLYHEDHTDITMPGAKGLGNSRRPLDAPSLGPIEPASLVTALSMIASGAAQAMGVIRGRLAGIPMPPGFEAGGRGGVILE